MAELFLSLLLLFFVWLVFWFGFYIVVAVPFTSCLIIEPHKEAVAIANEFFIITLPGALAVTLNQLFLPLQTGKDLQW